MAGWRFLRAVNRANQALQHFMKAALIRRVLIARDNGGDPIARGHSALASGLFEVLVDVLDRKSVV